ncbi:2OG-Fe(II) oxygenase, partial [Sphingopyxis sp.]|uniref:2OG-Fe(II) oxygenase n=1 Tax=Sphingopyxis sp. TaxID=1908224 RepID=UPI002ED9F2F5
MTRTIENDIGARLGAADWTEIAAALDRNGWAVLPRLLSHAECDATAALYAQEAGFRSHVHMARHGFGRGEYRYFAYPLPPLVAELRAALYPRLAPIANRWFERMGMTVRFPPGHEEFLARCHDAGQRRPTPLL